jgi:hypothetical protein
MVGIISETDTGIQGILTNKINVKTENKYLGKC